MRQKNKNNSFLSKHLCPVKLHPVITGQLVMNFRHENSFYELEARGVGYYARIIVMLTA